MVVAMAVVRKVQMTIDEIAGVVAVRHRFVTAARAMDVPGRVSRAIVAVGAGSRVQI